MPPHQNDCAKPRVEQLEDRSTPATISGTAFFDLNADGVQQLEEGEGYASGVDATLLAGSGSGSPEETVTTDSNGHFAFTGPLLGDYTVSFTAPAGYTVGTPAGGSIEVTVDTEDVGIGVGLLDEGGSGSGSGSSSSAYDVYLLAANQAYDQYNTAVEGALSDLDQAGENADSNLLMALDGAWATATSATAMLQEELDGMANPAVQSLADTIVSAYDTFSAAWDAAAGDLNALHQATDEYNAAVDAAYDGTVAALDSAESYGLSAIVSIQSTLDAAIAASDQAWDIATAMALTSYNDTEQTAWSDYISAEEAAWDTYIAAETGEPQTRQQMAPAQAPGPRSKPTPPAPFSLKAKEDGTGWKVEGPILRIERAPLPFRPDLEIFPKFDFNPIPKPTMPFLDFSGENGIWIRATFRW